MIDEGTNNDMDEEPEHEYNPMGLQIWSDEASFSRALDGGRLVLVMILAPSWCKRRVDNVGIRDAASLAAERLDETILSSLSSFYESNNLLSSPLAKPLIGVIDSTTATEGLVESVFGTPTHYPALKFVLTSPIIENQREEVDSGDNDDEDGHGQMQIWEYFGPRESAKDLYDSILMYWYRFVVSNALSSHIESSYDGSDFTNSNEDEKGTSKPPIFTFSSQQQLTTFLEVHGDRLLRPATPRRRHQSKLESEVFNFYMGIDERSTDAGGVFHPFEFLDEDNTAQRSRECSTSDKDHDDDGGANKGDCDESKVFTQEIDPYTLLVQCRSRLNYGQKVDEEVAVGEMDHLERQRKAMNDFDDLAEEMSHRMDVAFFALNATTHNENTTDPLSEKACDGLLFDGVEGAFIGAVAFFRFRRYITYSFDDELAKDHHLHEKQNHNMWNQQRRRIIHSVRTNWDEVKQHPPHALFVPTTTIEPMPEQLKEIYGKNVVKESPLEYVQSTLVASTVVHATPTVIWFDRDRMAQLAFPWYRKIHAVLFVDIGMTHKAWQPNSFNNGKSNPPWPSSLNHSTETSQLLLTQQKAIQLFYNAALRHRVERPADDVVFLVIPSSEVRIMTSFGIDIWTPLDEALFGTAYEDQAGGDGDGDGFDPSSSSDNGYCSTPDSGESRSILPVMMITDSSGRSGMQSSRYYLCSKDIFSSSPIAVNDGGAMGQFIDNFFSGTIGKPFVRSETPLPASRTASAQDKLQNVKRLNNVTILTGNTFESLVMDRNDKHTMVLMQTTSCGHCKRFSIFWNELSSLIQKMNWSSVINVMKIDVSKNDVPHDKINAWDLPAVYYFPAFEKEDPIEMTPAKEKTNPQNDYDEGLSWVTSGYDLVKWMVNQGKLDLELLSRLDGSSKIDDESTEKVDEDM